MFGLTTLLSNIHEQRKYLLLPRQTAAPSAGVHSERIESLDTYKMRRAPAVVYVFFVGAEAKRREFGGSQSFVFGILTGTRARSQDFDSSSASWDLRVKLRTQALGFKPGKLSKACLGPRVTPVP